MITGKGSIWKFAVLFVLTLIMVLDIIFCAQSKAMAWVNGIIVSVEIGWLIYNLYVKWERETLNDKACKKIK